MVLFSWGLSRLINKLSLIRRLNLFTSEARISKWSKSIEQSHSSIWSDTERIFITEQRIQLVWWLENNFKFTKFKLLSIQLTKRILSCIDFFPRKGRTQISYFFEAFSTTFFFIKTLSKTFLIQKSTKLLG